METEKTNTPEESILGIVIPAYNEEGRIASSILKISQWLGTVDFPVQVRIIVEKSTDKTLEVATKAVDESGKLAQIEVIDNIVQRGKGYAVRSGMLTSRGQILMFMDADLSVPLAEIPAAVKLMIAPNAPDILIGTRHDGGRIVKKQNIIRRAGSRGYNLLLRGLGLTGVADTQCGFKFFSQGAAKTLFGEAGVDGFGFDIEILMLAKKRGFSIQQIPVEWYNSDGSKFSALRDGPKVFLDALKTRLKML